MLTELLKEAEVVLAHSRLGIFEEEESFENAGIVNDLSSCILRMLLHAVVVTNRKF